MVIFDFSVHSYFNGDRVAQLYSGRYAGFCSSASERFPKLAEIMDQYAQRVGANHSLDIFVEGTIDESSGHVRVVKRTEIPEAAQN